MKKRLICASVMVILVASVSGVHAQTKLTPDAAKAFLDFYYNGHGQGVVLADLKICSAVEDFECTHQVSFNAVKKDSSYFIWMVYVVPKDDEVDDILVQFNHGGITRSTRDVSVKGSIRYRTWGSFTLNRAGSWEIKVLQDKGEEVETLRTVPVTVIE